MPTRSDPIRSAVGAAAGDVPARCVDVSLEMHDGPFEITRAPSACSRRFFRFARPCARAHATIGRFTANAAFRQLSITANTVAAFMQHPEPRFRSRGRRGRRKKKLARVYKLHCRHLLNISGNLSECSFVHASYRLFICVSKYDK